MSISTETRLFILDCCYCVGGFVVSLRNDDSDHPNGLDQQTSSHGSKSNVGELSADYRIRHNSQFFFSPSNSLTSIDLTVIFDQIHDNSIMPVVSTGLVALFTCVK